MAKERSVKISESWYRLVASEAKKEGRTIKGQIIKMFESYVLTRTVKP